MAKEDLKRMPVMAQEDDIETTKQLLQVTGDIAVYVTKAVKRGWSTSDLFQIMGMVNKVVAFAKDAKELLPELKDLDKEEAGELAELLYAYVKEIVDLALADKD